METSPGLSDPAHQSRIALPSAAYEEPTQPAPPTADDDASIMNLQDLRKLFATRVAHNLQFPCIALETTGDLTCSKAYGEALMAGSSTLEWPPLSNLPQLSTLLHDTAEITDMTMITSKDKYVLLQGWFSLDAVKYVVVHLQMLGLGTKEAPVKDVFSVRSPAYVTAFYAGLASSKNLMNFPAVLGTVCGKTKPNDVGVLALITVVPPGTLSSYADFMAALTPTESTFTQSSALTLLSIVLQVVNGIAVVHDTVRTVYNTSHIDLQDMHVCEGDSGQWMDIQLTSPLGSHRHIKLPLQCRVIMSNFGACAVQVDSVTPRTPEQDVAAFADSLLPFNLHKHFGPDRELEICAPQSGLEETAAEYKYRCCVQAAMRELGRIIRLSCTACDHPEGVLRVGSAETLKAVAERGGLPPSAWLTNPVLTAPFLTARGTKVSLVEVGAPPGYTPLSQLVSQVESRIGV